VAAVAPRCYGDIRIGPQPNSGAIDRVFGRLGAVLSPTALPGTPAARRHQHPGGLARQDRWDCNCMGAEEGRCDFSRVGLGYATTGIVS